MKKLLLSSVVLIAFSISIIIFQMSCQKTVTAQVTGTLGALNKILLQKSVYKLVGSTFDSIGRPPIPLYSNTSEFYLVGYNGGTPTRINIQMPAGEYTAGDGVIGADGDKLIFGASNLDVQPGHFIYSCSLDGSNLVRLVNGDYQIQGAY